MNSFLEFWNSLTVEKYLFIFCMVLGICHVVLLVFRTVLLSKKSKKGDGEEGVSVIITCVNKDLQLKENLVAFLEQDYPNFEVIVVDECSEDETQIVLADLQKKYPNLKISRIFPGTKFRRTKKIAINIGILAASHDILLFSEIDARPRTKNWIRTMQSYFTPETAVVLGDVRYETDGVVSVRNYFRFLRYCKMVFLNHLNMPIMGNGFNMAYRKKYYLEQRGFTKNTQEYIGFDTEMVQALSQKGAVKIAQGEDSWIEILNSSHKYWLDDVSYYCATKRRWPLSIYFSGAICLTFLIDLILINICLKQLGLKKLFITSLIVNMIGFVYKGYYSIYSIFTRNKWR